MKAPVEKEFGKRRSILRQASIAEAVSRKAASVVHVEPTSTE